MKLTVDWNRTHADGSVPARFAERPELGGFVVGDDLEGTTFLCIVSRVEEEIVHLRPTDRIC